VRLGKPEWLGRIYSHSVLKVNKISSGAKTGILQTDAKTQSASFLESGSNDFYFIRQFTVSMSIEKTA
jgi:hypothetical protein